MTFALTNVSACCSFAYVLPFKSQFFLFLLRKKSTNLFIVQQMRSIILNRSFFSPSCCLSSLLNSSATCQNIVLSPSFFAPSLSPFVSCCWCKVAMVTWCRCVTSEQTSSSRFFSPFSLSLTLCSPISFHIKPKALHYKTPLWASDLNPPHKCKKDVL